MNKTNFASLSLDTLTGVAGGRRDPGEPDDFAGNYVGTLEKDGKNWAARETLGAQALHDHNYGKAAKHFGAALLDEVGAAGDALSPILGGGVKIK